LKNPAKYLASGINAFAVSRGATDYEAGNCDSCAANRFPRIRRSFEEIRATLLKKI
jgi:hypothetical protein